MRFSESVLKSRPCRVLDLGAGRFEGQLEPFATDVVDGFATVTGFDGRSDADLAELSGTPSWHLSRVFVADGAQHTLYRCRHPGMSSLLKPSAYFASAYPTIGRNMEVISEEVVETRILDDLIDENLEFDFLKLDVQGAEGMVIAGGERTLKSITVMEVEVQFVEQYLGQPLGWDLLACLRGHGFEFLSFLDYGTALPAEIEIEWDDSSPSDHTRLGSRWLWANALLARSAEGLRHHSDEQVATAAHILANWYGAADVSISLIQRSGRSSSMLRMLVDEIAEGG